MRSIARENPKLLRLISTFHASPSSLVHPHRWPTDCPENVRHVLQGSARGRRRLLAWMEKSWKIDSSFRFEFASPPHRIALLEPNQVRKLILCCGGALHQNQIRQTIDGRAQTCFRECLGPEPYEFVLKRAAFVKGDFPGEMTVAVTDAESVEQSIWQSGLNCLAECLANAPAELRRRFELLLPPERTLSHSDQSSHDSGGVWEFVKRVLITEVTQEQRSCFD